GHRTGGSEDPPYKCLATTGPFPPPNEHYEYRPGRSAPRVPRPPPQPLVLGCGDPVAGAGHRRQYRTLHAARPDPPPQPAGDEARRAGDALPARFPQRQQHGIADALVSDLSGLSETRRAAR